MSMSSPSRWTIGGGPWKYIAGMSGLFSRTLALALAAIILESVTTSGRQTRASAYPMTAVPFSAVRLSDEFWTARLETNRTVTSPSGFRKSEEEGAAEELRPRSGPHNRKRCRVAEFHARMLPNVGH